MPAGTKSVKFRPGAMEFHAFYFLACLYQIDILNLNQYKHIINRTDSCFKVLIPYADDDIPVSYTHLDVYKRQVRYFTA